ncbi:hypothetical protein PSTG_06002 [Puccinia striiformis f. sp. tritici PST-78]|uniref:Uncharacterized protein n=1 Tax=Puccinia striiformis f. sp. tritici PST-78 TaxID=1165861 RepID=A0A0L0VNN0_9BASI|nr:hypothetical protein PSTG_06002 [Puccinia striiformis f. sp. tritici PST-78]
MSHSSDEDDALAEALLKRKTKPQSNPNRRRSSRFNNHQSEEEFSDREADSRHKSHSSPNRTRKSNHNHTVSRKRNRISDFGEEEQEEDEDHGDDLDVNDQDGNNNKDDHDNDNHDDNENDNNNNDDEPDCDMDDNIDELLDELQETHQLDNHYSQIAIKGAKASCNCSDSTTLSGKNAGTSSSPSTPAKDHEKFSNLVREKARALILKTDVESYTSQRDRRGDALDRSLMKLTRTVVEEQPKSFKSQYFPEGYDVPDYAGTKGYCDSLGQLLKYVQGQVCRLALLTNMLENKRSHIDGPIPSLDEVIKLASLPGAQQECHSPPTSTQNYLETTLPFQSSLTGDSFTRVQPLPKKHYTVESNRSAIGYSLKQVTSLPTKVSWHAALVIEKDEELFPPGGEYKDLNQDGVLMPTLQDVEDSLIDDPPT